DLARARARAALPTMDEQRDEEPLRAEELVREPRHGLPLRSAQRNGAPRLRHGPSRSGSRARRDAGGLLLRRRLAASVPRAHARRVAATLLLRRRALLLPLLARVRAHGARPVARDVARVRHAVGEARARLGPRRAGVGLRQARDAGVRAYG